MVEEEGYHCVCVSSDLAAYQAIPTLPTFKALVIDANLGAGGAGCDVARFGRRVIPELSIVLMSGRHTEEQLDSGMPDASFLAKPFSGEQLREAISDKLPAKGRRGVKD